MVVFLMRLDLTMAAKEELGRAAEARSRVRWQCRSDDFVQRSEKGKREEQGLPFNLEGEADRTFNREKMILTAHVVKK
jgi:hypothetical protein